MTMAETCMGTGTVDDRKEAVTVGGMAVKSPWKMPVEKGGDVAVMGAETWPALGDVQAQQRSKNSEVASRVTNPASMANGAKLNSAVAGMNRSQSSSGSQKANGVGSTNSSHRHGHSRHKGGSKRNSNGMPPFTPPAHAPVPIPVRVPYQPVPVVHHLFPPMVPPPFPVAGYGYPPLPPPFPVTDAQFAKSAANTPMQAFIPPPTPGIHANRNIPRPVMPDAGGHLYPTWHHHPHAFGPRDNILIPQNIGARAYMRNPLLVPPPTILARPGFPGPTGMYYLPVVPPSSFRAPFPPRLVPHPMNIVAPVPTPELLALRHSILKQFEYYFSDKNLVDDKFLIALMDDKGWASIPRIAEFNRVKSMSTDIPFIIDALQGSEIIEVQGDKVRKRDNWSTYLPDSEDSMMSNQQEVKSDGSSEEKIGSSSGEPLLSFDGTVVANEPLHRDLHEDVICVNTDSTGQDLVDHQNKTSCENLGLSGQVAIEHDALDVGVSNGLSTVLDTTSLHDEAAKVEQSLCVKDDLDSERRIDDFDDNEDKFAASNRTIERLEIVTQNCSESGAGSAAQEAKPYPNEIASEMNEQEHESERSCRQINYASETSDGNPGSPCTTPINMPGEGHTVCIESGSPGDRRKNKNSMQLAAHKQPPENHGSSTSSVSSLGNDVNGGSRGSSLSKPFLQSQNPSHRLLENFEQQTYQKYQKRCLADRKKVGIGRSKEMNTLYKFWLDYLRKAFVRSMYDKFLKLALEDAAANYLYGLQCLFTFYSDGLEQKFRDDLYNDFEKLTLDFYAKGDLYGLEKYWAFHHLRETRDQKEPMKKRAELERLLKEEFCTLDDFHRAKLKTEKKEPVQLTAVAEQ
ncbi:hypothetical protein Drorol1_Dr00003387 [Drosera rotundifolia]